MALGEWLGAIASQRFADFRAARLAYEDYIASGVPAFPALTRVDFERAARNESLSNAEAGYRSAAALSEGASDFRNLAVAQYQLGLLLHLQGRFAEAEAAFAEALEIGESLPFLADAEIGMIGNSCYHLGILAARTGRRTEGLRLLQRGLAIDKGSFDITGMSLSRQAIDTFFPGAADRPARNSA